MFPVFELLHLMFTSPCFVHLSDLPVVLFQFIESKYSEFLSFPLMKSAAAVRAALFLYSRYCPHFNCSYTVGESNI